ncbi:MAG: kelch repeat-containing protein, partial [Verrucomicrobiota bacterium]|nr:kelch repeat-containing protein [Verrucomicrobiota bacterium]
MKYIGQMLLLMLGIVVSTQAVPPVLNYAGQVAVDGEVFDGNGLFKFALVNADGTTTYWSNDGTSVNGSEPQASVAVPVNGGLYSLLLGNTAQQGMGAIDPAVFVKHTDAKLRVWFSDGVNGFQQLSPDRPFASVPYAFSAGIAQTAVSAPIANGAVTKSMLGSDVIADLNKTVTYNRLAPSAINAISSASLSSITDGKIKIVTFGQTPPSGYSLYHRGKAENLNWEFTRGDSDWSGGYRSVLNSDRVIRFADRTIKQKYLTGSYWYEIKSMDRDYYSHAVALHNGKVYITGGVTNGETINTVQVYDISSGILSDGNNLPIP